MSSRMSSRCSSAPGTRAYGKTSRELQFMYIITEIMYWKRHTAGFKAIPRYCLAQLKDVQDQPHCPGLEMSTAGLSVCLSVHPGLLLLSPRPQKQQARGTRGAGGLQHWVVSQGALLYCHFSKYPLLWLLASACRQGFKPEMCLSCQHQLTLEASALQRCFTCNASLQPPRGDAGNRQGWILKAGTLVFPSLPLHPRFPNSPSVNRHPEHQEASTHGWGRDLRAASGEQHDCGLVFTCFTLPGQTRVPQQDQLCPGRMLADGAEELLENLSPKPSSTSLLQVEGAG